MLSGLFKITINKINFEDLQYAIKNPNQYIIINTLPITEQDCLINGTIPYHTEEKRMNELLNNYDLNNIKIIIYGKNANDESGEQKYKQLKGLGFNELYLYCGGLFEWMLLQDIYGNNEFPTTIKMLDILKFKASRKI
jgi:hypothetical protein